MSVEPLGNSEPVRRLRILHVVPSYYPAVRYGGPIRSVHGLAAATARHGHEVVVYTSNMDGAQDLDVPLGTPLIRDGVAVHYFSVPALRRLCWCPGLASTLRQTIGGFDVVHLHSVFLWPTYAAARIAERAGVPYALSPRGSLVRDLIRLKSRWIKTAWIRLVERRTIRKSAALMVSTDQEADDVRGLSLPIPPLFIVANGVEWPDAPAPLSAGPFVDVPKPYALFLSRLVPKKGLERLIEAWRHVPETHLLIAGNDEEGYRPKLEAQVRAAGLEARIHFVGPVDDDHKWALYEQAELFVLPSFSENFGIVVAEAMAMRCPVVITPEVGLAALVTSSNAGMVVAGEPVVFAAAVRKLCADRVLRRTMGEQGRRTVAEHLGWDAIAEQAEAVYRGLLNGSPKQTTSAVPGAEVYR